MHPVSSSRPHRAFLPSRGFGLVQALVLLLLVSSALVAGIVLLQSRRGAEQTRTQEDSLRWAEEAVTSFAASNSRLPCPAEAMGGEEDCSGNRDSGWLPLQTLAGASGTAPGIGPLRYAVYRGNADSHLDLTQPLNAYKPLNLAGEPRTYDKDVAAPDGSTKTEKTPFDAINGLDFCQALGLAGASATDTALAGTNGRNALPLNIAYGVAAAGPNSAAGSRFDGDNDAGNTLESPWRVGSSDYDDRVRVQTFAGVAHAVGCRQIADAAINTTPYNISTASVDALAAALTLHDSVADLQDNNIGNANAAVRDAGFAQAMAAAQILLAAGHITDTVSSNITDVSQLITSIGVCIASLGTVCAPVALNAAAIGMEIGSIISYAAALGVNIGTVSMSAKALNKTIEVRDRAKNAVAEPVTDVGEAADKVCVAAHGGIVKERYVAKRDDKGNMIPIYDADGKQQFDENGVPKYEYDIEKNVWQDGLEQQLKQAGEVEGELRSHANDLYNHRIIPFNDGNISSRIDANKSIDMYNGRYQKWSCDPVSGGRLTWNNGACSYVTDDKGNLVPGGHEWVKHFNWTLATSDAIAKRAAAEEWALANREASDAKTQFDLANDNYNKWKDTLLPAMVSQKNKDCAKANSGSLEDQKKFTQICRNDEAAINYSQYCKKLETVTQPDGSKREVETLDTNPDSSCLPRLLEKRNAAAAARDNANTKLGNLEQVYKNLKSPYLNYPSDWAYWTLAEDGKTALGNPKYTWKQNAPVVVDINGNTKRPPYYFVNEHELLLTNVEIRQLSCLFGDVWANGTQCEHYPYSRAYSDWQTAKLAADEAKRNYDQLLVQYQAMSDRCEALKAINEGGPGAVQQANLAIGAEAILRRADELGSVGRQLPANNGTSP